MNNVTVFVITLALAFLPGSAALATGKGIVKITVLDTSTGKPTPARMQVKGAHGDYYVADNAVRFGGDCDMSDAGAGYTTLTATLAHYTDRLENPYTGTTQFYTDGSSTVSIPAGDTQITVVKGPEYRTVVVNVNIVAGATVEQTIELKRWIDMPARGWYSADDHLHIERPDPELNSRIITQMQAEDIHVANLLQSGKVRSFKMAPQYSFGRESHYQQGNYILAAGQENPRTHFLGHTITLGAAKPLFDGENYLIYRLIWEASVKSGGINGYAHTQLPAGLATGTPEGLALILPYNLLQFLEVLEWNRSNYDLWYDVLSLGIKVAPTAGTDYPCADQTIPGHERFYTRVDGELTYDKWIDAVRKGRTFVTTGPIAEFRINQQDIGSEILLPAPGEVLIEGVVTFDPQHDDLSYIELVKNGDVIRRFPRIGVNNRIAFSIQQRVDEASWYALRGYGMEQSLGGSSVKPLHFGSLNPTSNVHTAPIYVSLKGDPGLDKSAKARHTAIAWIATLDAIETKLQQANIERLGIQLETGDYDAVPVETLRRNRDALLTEIETAKHFLTVLTE